jgi:hypothetical protein
VKTFSDKVAAIGSAYKQNEQKIASEAHMIERAKWVFFKPQLDPPGPGCAPEAKGSVSCEIVPKSQMASAIEPVDATLPRVKTAQPDEPSSVRSPEYVCEPTTGAAPEPKTDAGNKKEAAPLSDPLQVQKALSDYASALAAVTKAKDRADFDTAAAKLSDAVSKMAGPYASAVKASSNVVLWAVGQDLDYRRLQALQNATRLACKPVHTLADALGGFLTGQQHLRVRRLHTLLGARIQAVNTARNNPGVIGETYGAALDDAQAAAITLQTVRAADPQATVQALKDAHDALVVAIRNNDGQFDALITSMQTFAQRANDLAAAAAATASTSSQPATKS